MSYPFDLGSWTRPAGTASPGAQVWFDRGLNWLYGYNQEEALACFQRALEHDPGCAMAHWGAAQAAGPFYNRPWIRFSPAEMAAVLPQAHAAADAAQRSIHPPGGHRREAPASSAANRALIGATALRYQRPDTTGLAELTAWHEDYCAAMRAAHAAHPEDADIAALFAEALITRTPRQLWNLQTGAPHGGSSIEEALAELEPALVLSPDHPGLLHILIHALEMSPFPERALPAAGRLAGLVPGAGHLEHMSAHIYILTGDYAAAVRHSETAIRADDAYLAHAGAQNFYTTARCHDLHLLIYAAMFLGQYQTALAAADRICAEATPALVRWAPPFMSSILDGYAAMRVHVLVRFGKWRELTAMAPPEDRRLTPIRAAMHHYGQGVAHAALSEIAEAEAARAAFLRACAAIPEEAVFLSNPVRRMLAVGEAMLEGELAYRKGDHDAGFAALRLAAARDDALNYTEPWAWMHPPRHALGALLLEQGRAEEAETVYRADLGLSAELPRCCRHPHNIWAMQGLLECLELRGETREAGPLRRRLDAARRHADVPVTASCCCRGMAPGD